MYSYRVFPELQTFNNDNNRYLSLSIYTPGIYFIHMVTMMTVSGTETERDRVAHPRPHGM